MKIYLKILAFFYAIGFLLHLADFLDLRLKYSEMTGGWKVWIVYLGLMDLLTAIGLWFGHVFGITLFFVVAVSQLIAYVGFPSYFGDQVSLIFFHLAALGIFFGLYKFEHRGDHP
jgi:hypothetical protein